MGMVERIPEVTILIPVAEEDISEAIMERMESLVPEVQIGRASCRERV